MAHHFSSLGFLQHGPRGPELRGHLDETQRGEELLSNNEHVSGIVALMEKEEEEEEEEEEGEMCVS